MAYCPLNASSYGVHNCTGRDCKLSDKEGNCLAKKYLEVSIEEKEFALAAKKRELDEQREKYLNATKILGQFLAQNKINNEILNIFSYENKQNDINRYANCALDDGINRRANCAWED